MTKKYDKTQFSALAMSLRVQCQSICGRVGFLPGRNSFLPDDEKKQEETGFKPVSSGKKGKKPYSSPGKAKDY